MGRSGDPVTASTYIGSWTFLMTFLRDAVKKGSDRGVGIGDQKIKHNSEKQLITGTRANCK